MLVYQPTACDSSTNECVIWLGFGNSYSANSTDFTIGLWFKIDSTNNSGLIQICNGTGTTVCQNTTAAFSAATWTHFVITVNAGATLATFYTGSTGSLTSIGTVNNHIPTIVSTPSVLEARITKLAGTTARTLSLDYVKYVQQFTTAR